MVTTSLNVTREPIERRKPVTPEDASKHYNTKVKLNPLPNSLHITAESLQNSTKLTISLPERQKALREKKTLLNNICAIQHTEKLRIGTINARGMQVLTKREQYVDVNSQSAATEGAF